MCKCGQKTLLGEGTLACTSYLHVRYYETHFDKICSAKNDIYMSHKEPENETINYPRQICHARSIGKGEQNAPNFSYIAPSSGE